MLLERWVPWLRSCCFSKHLLWERERERERDEEGHNFWLDRRPCLFQLLLSMAASEVELTGSAWLFFDGREWRADGLGRRNWSVFFFFFFSVYGQDRVHDEEEWGKWWRPYFSCVGFLFNYRKINYFFPFNCFAYLVIK